MDWLTNTGTTGGIATVGGFLDVAAKAALVLLVALAATRSLRRASASTRHQVWTVALICVLALPGLTGLLPAWRVPLLPAGAIASTPNAAPAPGVASDSAAHGAVASEPALRAPQARPDNASTVAPAGAAGDAVFDGGGVVAAASALFEASDWSMILVVAWLAGSAILLARVVASSLAACWLVRRSTPIQDVALRAEALAVKHALGIRSDVRLAQSGKISMPMAWGVLHPTVLLPAEAATWRHARRRVVLLHEMAHLKRRDCQTLLLARVVTALHWFNPLAWMATRRLQAERERACDDLVLNMGTRAPDYAQHLLEIARTVRSSASPNWAAVAMARPNELEGRLLAILDPDLNRRRSTRIATIAGLLTVGLLMLPLAALQPRAYAELDAQRNEQQRQEPTTTTTPVDETGLRSSVENQPELQLEAGVDRQAGATLAANAGVVLEKLPLKVGSEQQDQQGVDERVMAVLMTALRDVEPGVRAQAAASLGKLESPEAVSALGDVLQSDDDARVRSQAAWALGMIENADAVAALTAAASDEEVRVREQVAWALGMIESPGAVETLSVMLRSDESAKVREQAAWALGMIESADAVTALAAAASDEEVSVREQVAWAMGMIESSAAVETLSVMLRNDESAKVRQQAAWALGMIEDETALDALLDAMTDEDLGVRKQVLWAVGQIAG